MSEYLFTDLPRYVKTTPRENYANSVVKSGSVLLFSEDGENLVAKLPDGTFKEIGGGGSAEYYRCASVDTSSHTWTGYKAVLNGGVYTFENTVTQGLVYTSITPVIGNIYSADALVKVSDIYTGTANIPTQGLIFYASLAEDSTAETGQAVTTYGNISWGIISGIPCATFTNNSYLKYPFSEISGSEPSTLSAWLNSKTDPDTLSDPYQCGVEFTGTRNDNTIRQIGVVSDNYLGGGWYGSEIRSSIKAYNTGWHNVVLVYSYPIGKLYVDGVFQSSGTAYLNTTTGYLSIGADVKGETPFSGGIAACRVYDRALNEEEILELSKEFYI